MHFGSDTRFFLGANSRNGFHSLYDGFPEPDDFLWVLKGGPGCGKSTFMRRIGAAAEQAGYAVEYILCSGDPDSLDGVRIPEKHIAYVDGTAPHVIECAYPGAASKYLDMSCFLDEAALKAKLPELTELNREYKERYRAAYALLSAGAALLPKNSPVRSGKETDALVERRVRAVAARELPRRQGSGGITRRFLSAWSCRGRLRLEETVQSLCGRLILIDNEFGLGNRFLEQFSRLAQEKGCSQILCPDPLEPEKPEALLLPGLSLALAVEDRGFRWKLKPERRMHPDAAVNRALTPEQRAASRRQRRESELLLSSAVSSLGEAKRLHDALELCYRDHVDFDGASALAREHIRMLLPCAGVAPGTDRNAASLLSVEYKNDSFCL